MTEIFINYRTGDETFAAVLVDELLVAKFGHDLVFRDTRSIPLGEEFRDKLWNSLAESKVLLVIIGERWLTLETDGVRRLDMPGDYVRREIAYALGRDMRVVPLLIGDVDLPDVKDLPDEIKDLVYRQYMRIHPRNSHTDARTLANELAALLASDNVDPVSEAEHFGEAVTPATACSLLALKVEGFESMMDPAQATVRGLMYDLLRQAVRRAGVPWSSLVVKDRVDGVLVLAPQPVAAVSLVSDLVAALDDLLSARANQGDRTLRLRLAIHRGLATKDANGWAGQAVGTVWRLADEPLLGNVLVKAERARMVLIVSDAFHREVVSPGPGSVDPSTFLPLRPHGSGETAWVRVPGWSAPPGLPGLEEEPAPATVSHAPAATPVGNHIGFQFNDSARVDVRGDQVVTKIVNPPHRSER